MRERRVVNKKKFRAAPFVTEHRQRSFDRFLLSRSFDRFLLSFLHSAGVGKPLTRPGVCYVNASFVDPLDRILLQSGGGYTALNRDLTYQRL
jgi:hypothetical protein